MDPKSDEYLSAEELRDRLYHSLRGRGTVNSIKTQLRNSLLTELQKSGHKPVPGQPARNASQDSKLHSAVNSLIIDYLRRMKFDYSLSVFLPECGTSADKVLNCKEILQLLEVNPQSKLFRKLGSNLENEASEGFLWQFLCELSALHSTKSVEGCSQTDGVNLVPLSSLDDKLIGLDEYYSYRREDNFRSSAVSMEERLLSYQRQLEAESRRQLKLELARFKENDLCRMRLEEKENCRQEIERTRKEMEKTYQARVDALAEKERNTLKRLEKDQEIQSREVYSQRQTVLGEIETVRQREAQARREAETLIRERELMEERMKSREEAVRKQAAELSQSQRQYDQRLEADMAQFKMEEQTKFMKRTQNLEQREIKIKEEEQVLKEDKRGMESLKSELREKTAGLNRLELLLQETKTKEVSASCSNETLSAKIREMSDYSILKEENFRLKTELDTLRMQLKEMTQLYARTQSVLGRVPGGRVGFAGEVTQDGEPEHSPRRSQSDITMNREVERNRELLRQFEESTQQQREMYREMMDLRQQLHLTQQALNNEVYRKPKHTKSDDEISGASLVGDWSGLKDGPRTVDNEVYNDVDVSTGAMMAPPRTLDYGELSVDDDAGQSDTGSADVVAEAKYRLRSLEREAQNLEQTYRDFHYRLTNVHAVSPSTVRSPAKVSLPTFTQELSKQADVKAPVFGRVAASPIPTVQHEDSLVSSTPCKQTLRRIDSNDSLSELTTPRGRPSSHQGSEFQPSHLSEHPDIAVERDSSKLITLADLEQRPGSPSVVVMAASDSSGSKKDMPARARAVEEITEKPNPPTSSAAVLSLDQVWQTTSNTNTIRVEDGHGELMEKTERDKAEERREKEERALREEEEERRWEEDRKRREDERKLREQRDWERAQEELGNTHTNKPAKDEEEEVDEKSATADPDDNIDPVMKKYMAMVQQQKLQEQQKQQEKTEEAPKEKSPVHSENDISFAEDIDVKSDNGSIPDFDW